jgi:2-keto-3-deoxy-L-rhamnonate aldolase RhmA
MITRDPALAAEAARAGVDYVFVDLESLGKAERQKGRAAVFSGHTVEDVARVRAAVPPGKLLVRTNPLHRGSDCEVEAVIGAGADRVMLPMFRTGAEVEDFLALVAGRVPVILLVETRSALEQIEVFARFPGVAALHLGLNDLAIEYGYPFLFQVVAAGLVEEAFARSRAANPHLPLGFGGVGRLDATPVSGRLVLAEHQRLGSAAVILSRVFHGDSQTLDEVRHKGIDLGRQLGDLRAALALLAQRPTAQVAADHDQFIADVDLAARTMAAASHA